MSSWFEELTEEERKFFADEAKRRIAAKKEGSFCLICSEFYRYAEKNCYSKGKQVFICFPCRNSTVNQVIYDIQEEKDQT